MDNLVALEEFDTGMSGLGAGPGDVVPPQGAARLPSGEPDCSAWQDYTTYAGYPYWTRTCKDSCGRVMWQNVKNGVLTETFSEGWGTACAAPAATISIPAGVAPDHSSVGPATAIPFIKVDPEHSGHPDYHPAATTPWGSSVVIPVSTPIAYAPPDNPPVGYVKCTRWKRNRRDPAGIFTRICKPIGRGDKIEQSFNPRDASVEQRVLFKGHPKLRGLDEMQDLGTLLVHGFAAYVGYKFITGKRI